MVVYACSCLNVRIFADAIKLKDVNHSSPLGQNVLEIELGDRGFEFSEDDVLAQLAASPDFSPVFQILLKDQDFHSFPDRSADSYNRLQQQLSTVTQQMQNFLIREENIVEAKIRHFEEEQRAYLAQRRAKAQDDKRKLISVLLQQTDPCESTKPVKVIGFQNGLINPSGVLGSPSVACIPLSPPEQHVREKMMPDTDRDEMFLFDDFDDDGSPQNNSSDEEEDTGAGQVRRPTTKQHRPSVYSASLPVNIRRQGTTSESDSDSWGDEEDEGKPVDLDVIGSSMQALAKSVCDEGRYIFGDRPRPRLNKNRI